MWREHLPYNSSIDVTAGDNKIYCATPYSLFSVDLANGSIERLSKITGLAETGVSAVDYDETNHKLIIAYNNSNIDIIYREDVFNIPDLKRKTINADKSVYSIYSLNNKFYLCTGFGVVVIDADKYEIKDSWIIGSNGTNVKVNGFAADANYFYAATTEGLKRTSTSTTNNPANYLNWELLSGANGLSGGPCADVISNNNKIIAAKNDSLFVWNGSVWNLLYSDGNKIVRIKSSEGKIVVCQVLPGSGGKVVILNNDGSIARVIQQNGVINLPRAAISHAGSYWVADQQHGLLKYSAASVVDEIYSPNSPGGVATGEMLEHGGVLYATAGAVDEAWTPQRNAGGVYFYKDGQWENFDRSRIAAIDSMFDFITAAVDPVDQTIWAGSFGGGLLHIKTDQTAEIFKQGSALKPAVVDPASYRVAGLRFDSHKNLWISNFGATQPLVVRKNDGNWKSFSPAVTLTQNALSQIVVDEADQLWIVSPLSNGLLCYNHGSSIDDFNDDRWKLYKAGAGNGNLPSNNVLCIAKDKSGFIWVGTDDGIGIVQCPTDVFNGGCDATLPVIEQGNFAGFLFKGENVAAIAVDGADRKWVGTKNGVWLISREGDKVLARFTEDNSPLLNNDVKRIAVNGATGEIFFATAKGICSFRGNATEGGETTSNVLVFPNPVPPGYSGTIGIRGLAENSTVKITELDGRLVYQSRALGGQAVWDGKDYSGRRIASGIYLVLVSSDNKKERVATKIVFISR